jgi:hypothetical protein
VRWFLAHSILSRININKLKNFCFRGKFKTQSNEASRLIPTNLILADNKNVDNSFQQITCRTSSGALLALIYKVIFLGFLYVYDLTFRKFQQILPFMTIAV